MIIRCPQCEYARTISESKIPSTAELATCPKCRHRFRFRTLPRAVTPESAPAPSPRPAPRPAEIKSPADLSGHVDIWDAVDSLHHRWQTQIDMHVVEVETPRPAAAAANGKAPAEPETPGDSLAAPSPQKHSPSDQAKAATAAPVPAEPLKGAPAPAEPSKAASLPAPEKSAPASPAYTRALSVSEESAAPGGETAARSAAGRIPAAPPTPAQTPPAPGLFDPAQVLPSAATCDPAQTQPATGTSGVIPSFISAGGTSQPSAAPKAGAAPAASSRQAAVFSYALDGTPPEERVERDLRMLQATADRPLRDLGRLVDTGLPEGSPDEDGQESGPSGAQNSGGDIPWEVPARHGWLRAFMRTVHGVMFNAPSLFSRVSGEGALGSGYLFFLILGYLAILCSLAWARAAVALMDLPATPSQGGTDLLLPLLLAPIGLGLIQMFITGGIKVALTLFAPAQADFPKLFKIVGYAVSPLILSIVPFVGPPAGALWSLIALFMGCRFSLGLSWQLAVAAPLPPVLLLGAAAWYVL